MLCLGVVNTQNIHFLGSLPPTDCISLYKTYIGCILHILGYIDAKFDRRYSLLWVDIMVQPCEIGLITVYLCTPETVPQNGVGRLLQIVICLPTQSTDVSTRIHCRYARVKGGKIWWRLVYFFERYGSFNIYPLKRLCFLSYPSSLTTSPPPPPPPTQIARDVISWPSSALWSLTQAKPV